MIRATFVTAAVPGLVVLPAGSFAAGPQPEPVTPGIASVALDRLFGQSEGMAPLAPGLSETPEAETTPAPDTGWNWTTAPIETDPFLVAGVTWAQDPEVPTVEIEVRTRSGGSWSEWVELLAEESHAPDPGTAEAERARRGTEPLLVDASDAVQIRIDAVGDELPRDLRLSLVDPGYSDADLDVGRVSESAAAAAPAMPTVYTRAQWGADESLREPGNPDYGQVLGAFVHHTAGTNTYTPSQVPAIIRGIYAYHVNGRGWRDIGYNFLVDKFGRIWEGRFGGIDRAVVGAHTLGYNSNAFAMSALGTYTSSPPTAAMISAYQRLFAWKFWLHGVNPSVTVAYPGQRAQYPIAGHRNAGATECPGSLLYAQLGTIRAGTNALLDGMPRDRAALRLTAPASADVGKAVRLDIAWSAGGWVTGQLNLQRLHNGRWEYLRRVHVTNGRASVTVGLDRSTTYRVYAVFAPGVQLTVSRSETVIALLLPSAIRLAAPDFAPEGSAPASRVRGATSRAITLVAT